MNIKMIDERLRQEKREGKYNRETRDMSIGMIDESMRQEAERR
jgi:hypothetical protein